MTGGGAHPPGTPGRKTHHGPWPYAPTALVFLTDLSKRWTASDLAKITRLADDFARREAAPDIGTTHLQGAEREYRRGQTTELRFGA
jgi:hypothetical protein